MDQLVADDKPLAEAIMRDIFTLHRTYRVAYSSKEIGTIIRQHRSSLICLPRLIEGKPAVISLNRVLRRSEASNRPESSWTTRCSQPGL
jgi:hypothetical protein